MLSQTVYRETSIILYTRSLKMLFKELRKYPSNQILYKQKRIQRWFCMLTGSSYLASTPAGHKRAALPAREPPPSPFRQPPALLNFPLLFCKLL